ncbi:MAG: type IV pili methyl-accepting chemotaxis transducer N-terminal domain-containing protein [Burkholderiales bacterium]|nr:type IV pili methyl-accepting chemotaxis transducer N-terminal domain-containing protein [Burkholderiales bacterium]
MALNLGFGRGKNKKGSEPKGGGTLTQVTGFGYTEMSVVEDAERAAGKSSAPAPRSGARGTRGGDLIERFLAWRLPLIGDKPINTQVQVLLIMMALFAIVVAGVLALDLRQSANGSLQVEITGDALMHTQRLARAAPYAVIGNKKAFADLRDSRDRIDQNLDALANGDRTLGLTAAGAERQEQIGRLAERWRASQAAASVIIAQEKSLLSFGDVIRKINEASPRLLQLTEEIVALKLQQGAPAREVAASSQLVMLTQRLGRSANSLIGGESANAELALTLGRDINLFRDLALALLQGSEALRIAPSADSETRARLQELTRVYGDFQSSIGGALSNLQAIVQAKDAELAIVRDTEALRQAFTDLQSALQKDQRIRVLNLWIMVAFGLGVLSCAVGIAKVLLDDTRKRATEAEEQRSEAQKLEEGAKRTNERSQAAILRLMNELQEVADGNLTVQATVTEDITGAIADSVNYTVEELRGLVGRINTTAEQVSSASTVARDIATRLLTASEQQSREIKDTGEKVLKMAGQINEVSRSAGESAKVARSSLEAAERGQRAVYNQIAGMNEIREQIQETAKRIKRLGESSQEIGEIVELITDITEQTNVLALNAAIQAASAGEAGRGFSVVAEEVQRLADRSAEAAKQIGALVRTIQTDTQDAVAAMEKSTQGVVEGTKLSDAAGTALADIGRVSRQLAELIERIAGNTNEQAASAGGVAHSIERILAVTDQTSQGTRQAAQSIGQLATLARELKASVARFRVG